MTAKNNDNVSERLMLLDYEFHTVLKYKTTTHISFTSLTITSRSDQKTYSLKRTSNILLWINEDLISSTAFSTPKKMCSCYKKTYRCPSYIINYPNQPPESCDQMHKKNLKYFCVLFIDKIVM